MSGKSALGAKLDALAMAIATDALMADRSLDARLGAMKVLTAYYATINKIEAPEMIETVGGFRGYKQAIDLASSRRAGGAARRNGAGSEAG